MPTTSSPSVVQADDDVASARSQKETSRLTGAEGLRALACLNVFFFHAVIRANPESREGWFGDVYTFLATGTVGVAVFFVLSGMLLSYRFWMAYFTKTKYPSLAHFVRRRASRILPAFYVVLVVSYIVDGLYARGGGQALEEPVRRLIGGLTLTSSWNYVTYFPTESDIPLWAVPMEAVCYVLLPLAMWGLFAIRRRGRVLGVGYWLGVIAFAAIVHEWIVRTFPLERESWNGAVQLARDQLPERNPFGYFGQFAIGVLAAAAIVLWKIHKGGRRSWWFDAVAAGLSLAIVVFFWSIRGDWDVAAKLTNQGQPYYYPYFAIVLAALAICLCFSRFLWRLFEIAPLKFVAKYSYGIYLWHALVFDWFARHIDWRYSWATADEPVQFVEATVVCFVITVFIAMISWRVIERPFVEGWLSGQKKARAKGNPPSVGPKG